MVFEDRCTKEMAAAPIGAPQQQGQAQPDPTGAGDTEPCRRSKKPGHVARFP